MLPPDPNSVERSHSHLLQQVLCAPLCLMCHHGSSHSTCTVKIQIDHIYSSPFDTRARLSPAAWGSRDHQAPHLHPPQGQKQCGNELAGCPGLPAPWSSCASGSPPSQPSPCRCSPPSGPGSWCTWGADSWQTSWRWQFHSGLWPCGTDLKEQMEKIRIHA